MNVHRQGLAVTAKWLLAEFFSPMKRLDFNETGNRKNQVVVITGGTGKIGSIVVEKLLEINFTVVIVISMNNKPDIYWVGGRDPDKAEKMIADIRAGGNKGGSTKIIYLDLAKFSSVRAFADKVLKTYDCVHFLINNAGVKITQYSRTEDGIETHLQVNYLSHYLLIELLTPALQRAATKISGVRIINTSAAVHYAGKLDFENLNSRYNYNRHKAFFNSKLAIVMLSIYLNGVFKEKKIRIELFSLHPGSSSIGADHIVFAALSSSLTGAGGSFLGNMRPQKPNAQALKLEDQKKLYEISEKFTRIMQRPVSDDVMITEL